MSDRAHESVKAAIEMGRAVGLRQGAAVLRALADHKGRVVGTNALKSAAQALEEKAAEVDAKARETLGLAAE
jgi:hypothetical protein